MASGKLNISCLEAVNFIDRKHTSGLNIREKLALRIHKGICKYCLRYDRQQEWINEALNRLNDQNVDTSELEDLKKKIKEAILHN
ncbi:MAG: hypothetical protein GC181_01295 [Bacteroidetes bacterium]|nr:hypothetical protein [Bacteroidota bacterium]